MTRRYLSLLALPILASCAHAPSAPPAPSNLPSRWEAGAPAATGEISGAWWKGFGDTALDGLIGAAEERNVDLRLAAERVLESNALRRAATAGLFPEVNAGVNLTETRPGVEAGGGSSGAFSPGATWTTEFGAQLSATWEPDVTGRLSAAVRAARAETRATMADAEAVRLLLVREVADNYIDYRLQRALVALIARTVATQEETLRITRERFEFGMASDLDVQRAASLVAQIRSESAVAVEAADAVRFRLSALLATTPDEITARLSANDDIPYADPLRVLLSPAEVLARRPDIEAATARFAAAGAGRDIAAAARLPSVTLSGLIGLSADGVVSLVSGGAAGASLAASLIQPVLDFGRRSAELDAADSRLRQAGLEDEQVTRTALQEVQTTIVSYVQGLARERDLAHAADAARRAADLSRLQYGEGTLSQLEVLDAARTVFQAERDHAQATADVATRLVSLYSQMGIASDTPVAASLPAARDATAP